MIFMLSNKDKFKAVGKSWNVHEMFLLRDPRRSGLYNWIDLNTLGTQVKDRASVVLGLSSVISFLIYRDNFVILGAIVAEEISAQPIGTVA